MCGTAAAKRGRPHRLYRAGPFPRGWSGAPAPARLASWHATRRRPHPWYAVLTLYAVSAGSARRRQVPGPACPVTRSDATMMDLFDATEMTEIVREAEAMTEAFMKSEIERMAREFYHRLRQIC
jgi:hypothetical protein